MASSTAPWLQMPSELLSDIFLCSSENGIHALTTPSLVSQVCSTWREIAIHTPRLWSRLTLRISTSNSERQFAKASTWLKRSGDCTLFMNISWAGPPFPDTHPVIEVLVHHSHHWREISFFSMPLSACKLISRVKGNIPLLSKLSIRMAEIDGSRLDHKLDMFETAPCLHSVGLDNISIRKFNFPWMQISAFTIMPVAIDELYDILAQCPNLESANFMCHESNFELASLPVLVHTKLQDLSIIAFGWMNDTYPVADLFRSAALPDLRTIEIYGIFSPFGRDFSSFLSKATHLRKMELAKVSLSGEELVSCLRATPALISLIAEKSPDMVTAYLLNELTVAHTAIGKEIRRTPLVPKLRKLKITVPVELGQLFVDMLRSRWDDGIPSDVSRLEKIVLKDYETFDPDIVQQLTAIDDSGLSISVTGMRPRRR